MTTPMAFGFARAFPGAIDLIGRVSAGHDGRERRQAPTRAAHYAGPDLLNSSRRHGRVLRVGRTAGPARASRPAGHCRRLEWPRSCLRRLVRGTALRREERDADGLGPPALPARRL